MTLLLLLHIFLARTRADRIEMAILFLVWFMSYLRSVAKQVEAIYKDSHESFSSFQSLQKLNCLPGCGKCCLNKEISCTPLEMLPTAFKLYDENKAEEILENLTRIDFENANDEMLQCIFYERHSPDGSKGQCTNYLTRPCVCRSFGAAATTDKNGKKVGSVCKLIKEASPEAYKAANFDNSPVIGEFARKVMTLDNSMGSKYMPINLALKEALEKVLFSESYLPKRENVV